MNQKVKKASSGKKRNTINKGKTASKDGSKSKKKATAKRSTSAKAKPLKKRAKVRIKTADRSKKSGAKTTAKRKLQPTVELTHGDDLHLIPVYGDINPAGHKDSARIEKFVHQQHDTIFHQENARVKQAMASRKNVKGMFRNFRQS